MPIMTDGCDLVLTQMLAYIQTEIIIDKSSCHPMDKNTELLQRAFTVCGPAIWNSLPPDIRTIDSYHSFQQSLKSYMFILKAFNITPA